MAQNVLCGGRFMLTEYKNGQKCTLAGESRDKPENDDGDGKVAANDEADGHWTKKMIIFVDK